MEGAARVRSNQRKSRTAMKKSFSDCALPPMKVWLQSQKELCTVSTEELEESGRFNEVTFLCFADETAMSPKEFAAVSVELLDLLKSLHLCNLNENEVIFLKDIHKPLESSDVLNPQNCPSQMLCVMRLTPSQPRLSGDFVFTLLSKYAAGIRCTMETYSLPKHTPDLPRTEDDDTNHSVSSIEDDFVTALEHLDEDESTKKINPGQVTPEKLLRDAASQTIHAPYLDSTDPRMVIKPSSKPSALLVNILELKGFSPSIRRSVATSASDPGLQMDFFRPYNSSDPSVNLLHKTLCSSSPAESSESECSSPSPVIFLDEEGYQRSLKAKLQLPKIPVMKDGIEDSDSEVSEFFDSFDQFDDQEQALQTGCQLAQDPTVGHLAPEKAISCKKSSCATTAMNPQKFQSDCPALPADVRKPTPRKPESLYTWNLWDVPDSPCPMKASADEGGGLFSPIRSSAFSPLSNGFSSECLCQPGSNRDSVSQNHSLLYHTYSDFAETVSFEILGCVFNSWTSSLRRYSRELSNHNRIVSQEEKVPVAEIKGDSSRTELDKKSRSKQKALMIKDHIQKFASELVEKSFGNAFKDLQRSVSSCTNVLCHLAAKLTSSAFQMAFYELGRQRSFSLKKKAIGGLAGFLASEAITGALKELHSMKQQIFTNTVAKFATDLAEELIFEGIMEVCQFSHPSTPAASQDWPFRYDDKVVWSYAEDLSDSVIQEAFIELSQTDATFTTQAAISVSMNNMKYVSAESILESTQTSSAYANFHDKVPVALNPVQELRKEYTIHSALFYTSGIASSVPVPLAGSALCQNQILTDSAKRKSCSASVGHPKTCKDSAELSYATRKRQEEVTSLRSVYLTTGNGPGSECNTHILCKQSDSKQAYNPEISNVSRLAGLPVVKNFSGTMVDMIVTEAYETVTSSKVSKTSEYYTDILRTEKMPYLQCIGEDTCRNVFVNYLAKQTVKQSVDETKSPCSATSEKLAYCVGLGTNKDNNKAELHSATNQPEKKNSAPVIVGQQQMPLNSLSKFHVTPVYCNRHLLSGSEDCLQESKWHVDCRFSTCTSPPCSGTFVKRADEFPETERYSAKPLSNPLETRDMHKTAGCSTSGQESTFPLASVVSNCNDAFHIEDRSRLREGTLCVVPNTPPPTPLTPSQASSEWNLRNLTKQLKGELAKQFAPATPPSTPYRSEVDGVYENEHYYLEKEEFMLKLMRSLSEEAESSEDEYTEMLAEKVKASIRTLAYADHLATCIISVATKMAASHLDNETIQTKNNFQLNMESKRYGSPSCMNVSEKKLCSLWIYASDVAGKVISEAKKIVKSRHCKRLRLKQVNHQADSLHLKRNCNECWSKEKKLLLADQWSKEADSSILSLPQSSEAPGLTSKFPSCESVTDEYADHIIRILKREGGHGDLIMEQFASRLAYRSIKSGMQQAACKLKMKHNRKVAPGQNLQLNNTLDPFELVNKDVKKQKRKNIRHFGKRDSESKCSTVRTEYPKLLDFSESLTCGITSDVRRKLKMSYVCLPKSLTDSCLYKKSQVTTATDDLKTFSKMQPPFCCKQKLYHSTGSLNECVYRDGLIHAIERYARKIVDDTLEVSLESAALHTTGNWTNGERSTYAEKLSPFSATACRYCCMKEHQYCTGSPSARLPGQELHSKGGQISDFRLSGGCQKSRILHLDIPKIHINMDEKVVFAENVIATSFDKAERQLSSTSLAADSGIGHDGISFAESLTTEIMTSCMTNMGQAVNISSVGEEGFLSAESVVSQQMSLSTGEDSTGSWSNLSFEDEQPEENSSFLHLSESSALFSSSSGSLGNSSSWSSLGLEGDMYEENLSFPTSDSDGTEEKEEELRNTILGLGCQGKSLVIINVDLEPCLVDSQLRMTLQWLSASEAEVAEIHFHNAVPKEFVLLLNRLRERGWKVGDLFQAVLKYCEATEKIANGERALESQTLFGWLQNYL